MTEEQAKQLLAQLEKIATELRTANLLTYAAIAPKYASMSHASAAFDAAEEWLNLKGRE